MTDTLSLRYLVLHVVLLSELVLGGVTFPGQMQAFDTQYPQYQQPNEYSFFSTSLRRPARNQGPTNAPTTYRPSTSTQREFTGIAFPPQVFEILTGSEPTTQNLGGRKNATQPLMNPSTPGTTGSPNLTQVPELINGATRPPTRFPPGNKPPYIRPTPRPQPSIPLGSNSGHQASGMRPSYGSGSSSHSRPQAGSIAAAPSPLKPNAENPDNRVGSNKNPMPISVPVTTQNQNPSEAIEATRSIRSVHQYLQSVLVSGAGSGSGSWDGTNPNFLVSPLSVGLTMAQMMMAAGPRAKTFLRGALRLYTKPDPHEEVCHELNYHKQLGKLVRSIQRHDGSSPNRNIWSRNADPYSLESNTAIFVQTRLMVRPTFIHGIENLYQGRLTLLDFSNEPYASVSSINQWAENVSHGKIKQFLSGPPSPNTAALFASSLYFKAPWRNSFNEMLTSPAEFHVSRSEKVTVPFMRGEICDGSKFIDSSKFGVKALGLAYNETDEIILYMFLPKNENTSIQDLAKKLLKPNGNLFTQRMDSSNFTPIKSFQDPLPASWEAHKQASSFAPPLSTRIEVPDQFDNWELDEIISSMKSKDVTVTIPKLVLRGSLRLNPPGTSGRDQLAGLLEDPGQALGATSSETILHETVLELSETGTEAAAITAGSIDYMSGSAVFKADRPFLILLRHEPTGLPLFWGAVVRPNHVTNSRHYVDYRLG